jgi:phosphopantetheine--protein transferase-like protein
MSILQVVSLGNDIVDLNDPDSIRLSENKKFLNKVYDESELVEVSQSPENIRHIYLWKLWAAKEAAYKAVKRLRRETVFSPKLFCYHPDRNIVAYKDITCRLEFLENSRYVHASAFILGDDESVSSEINRAPSLFSQQKPTSGSIHDAKSNIQPQISDYDEIRKMIEEKNIPMIASYSPESALCRMFAAIEIGRQLDAANVRLEKDSDSRSAIPRVWVDNVKTDHLVSTSHHGQFCAVLFYRL